jgi:hypothetical protein
MSTKLLHQIHQQDQEALAARYNGEHMRQPRRIWAVQALKTQITEAEWFAATRAIEECGSLFEGREPGAGFQIYRDRDTGMLTSGKEQSALRETQALQALYGLRQAVSKRCNATLAPNCAEWIVQRHTLQDIAIECSWWRSMGKGRDPIPDTRPVKPFVRLVLLAMAGYYEDCSDTMRAA